MVIRRVAGRPAALFLAALLCVLATSASGSNPPATTDTAPDVALSTVAPSAEPETAFAPVPEATPPAWSFVDAPPVTTPASQPTPDGGTKPTVKPRPDKPSTAPRPKPKPVSHSHVKTVTVASIAALKSALRNNSIGMIVVRNGTYHVSPASQNRSDSLWIGSAYAHRTRSITVRAQTRGHVTFDGGGTSSFGCITFTQGAHGQTWDGFNCANGRANNTGVITFGGYAGYAAPHHITMKYITIKASCRGSATSASSQVTDHAFYISEALGGPHNLVFLGITVDGRGGLASAFHFYHSNGSNKNAWAVSIRGLRVYGTQQAIMLWDGTIRNVSIVGATITGALRFAVRFEGGSGIMLSHITSTKSGGEGFHSSMGAKPPGVTFSHNSFH